MITLGECIGGAKRIVGGPFGSNLTQADYTAQGVPVIRGSNMEYNGRWVGGDFACVSFEKVNSDLRNNLARPGDIIVTQRGTMGQVSIIPEESSTEQFVISQSQMAISVDQERASRDFVYYYLRSPKFLEYLSNSIIQTGVPHINLGILRQAPVAWPDLKAQISIASVLATLDDKIELNRRMNETLEAMVRTIFKDWFVDFGPTRAKAEGCAPYLASDLWSIFPDRLDNDGKPEGWEYQTVFSQANWVNGAAYRDMYFNKEMDSLPVVKIAEMKNGITESTKFTNTSLGDKYLIDNGELLFSWSGNPDTSIDTFIWTHGKAWLNQHIFAVRSNDMRSTNFLYAMLKFLKPEFSEIARNKQTTGLGHVTLGDLKRMKVSIPDAATEEAFEKIAGPLLKKLYLNLLESQTITQTRDLLLPKLMSGEIRVRDAEILVENAL